MALDPTRPVMVDGGNCLMDESLPVNGVHYQESYWRDYPDEAYTLAKALSGPREAAVPAWGKMPWRLVPDRPIFMGEVVLRARQQPGGFQPVRAARAASPAGGRPRGRAPGCCAKMLAEGYRWHGVAAQHFWFGAEDADAALQLVEAGLRALPPVELDLRRRQRRAAHAQGVQRHAARATRSRWPGNCVWAAKPVGGRAEGLAARPRANTRRSQISVAVPQVSQRTAGQFVLTCSRGGKEVFREVKHVAVIDPDGGAKAVARAPGNWRCSIRTGRPRPGLQARGIAFTEVEEPGRRARRRPGWCVVGKDALSARDATDPRWLALAARGARLLVLEQAQPAALPGHAGRPDAHRLRRPRGLPGEPGASGRSRAWSRPISSPGRAITSSIATSTGRPRAARSRWPIATSSSATRPSPSARSTRA